MLMKLLDLKFAVVVVAAAARLAVYEEEVHLIRSCRHRRFDLMVVVQESSLAAVQTNQAAER